MKKLPSKSKPRSRSKSELHKEHVLKDPEFLVSANKLKSKIHKVYGRDSELNVTIIDGQVLVKIADNPISIGLFGDINNLAREYQINPNDIFFFLNNYSEGRFPTTNNRAVVGFNGQGQVYINIDVDTTKQDIEDNWESVEIMKEMAYGTGEIKIKPPVYDKLIYAIFRQRQKGKSFKQIYDLYKAGSLPLYNSGSNRGQFETSDSLSRYYRKYQP